MNSSSRRLCFLSFPWGDPSYENVIREAIQPALAESGWQAVDPRHLAPGVNIFDSIAQTLRKADLVIVDLGSGNLNVIYELGLAHGWGKNTVVLSRKLESIPFDIASRYNVLAYSTQKESLSRLKGQLTAILLEMREEPLSLGDPSLDRLVESSNTISIELFQRYASPVQTLRYVSDVTSSLGTLIPLGETSLTELRVGSLGAWIKSEAQSIASLAEKIIFFVPEWRMKKALRVKVDAEAELLLAQAEHTRAQASEIDRESKRKDALAFLELVQGAKSVGSSRITFGDRLQIDKDEDGNITVGVPKKPARKRLR